MPVAETADQPVQVNTTTGEITSVPAPTEAETAEVADTAADQGYARARASDMTSEMPERAREARLASAKSFPTSIRAALARIAGGASKDRSRTAGKPQERDRSLEQGL